MDNLDLCPFVGLQPFDERDSRYFFGRGSDQRIIFSNLYASTLTILYGPSGVGKSSVLRAGVVPLVRRELGLNPPATAPTASKARASRPRGFFVYFNRWSRWEHARPTFLDKLKSQCIEAAAPFGVNALDIDASLGFDVVLCTIADRIRKPIFIILDQFEEYLLYNPEVGDGCPFDSEFAATLGGPAAAHNEAEDDTEESDRRAISPADVHVLIALREDALSQLDRYQTKIPNLLANTIRLQHLTKSSAEAAIREPLRVYNQMVSTPGAGEPMTIEDGLINQVLDDVRSGRAQFGEISGAARAAVQSADQIEAAFLQLVMTRLWQEELTQGSRSLRLATLRRLGGVELIIRRHVDRAISTFTDIEKDVAAQMFRFLVTPTGSKFALSVDDLVGSVERGAELVRSTLERLDGAKVLRRRFPPEQYEILHDVLAGAVLDWRRRYLEEQAIETARIEAQKKEQEAARLETEKVERLVQAKELRRRKRTTRLLSTAAVLLMLFLVATIYQYETAKQNLRLFQQSEEQRETELVVNQLVDASEPAADTDPQLSFLYSWQAAKALSDKRLPVTQPVKEAIESALAALNVKRFPGTIPGSPVAFLPGGRELAFLSANGSLTIWDIETATVVKALPLFDRLARATFYSGVTIGFSPDGERLIASGVDGAAEIFDLLSGQQILKLRYDGTAVFLAAFLSNNQVATAGDDGVIRIWDASPPAREITSFESLASGRCLSLTMCDNGGYLAAALFASPSPTISTKPSPSTALSLKSSIPNLGTYRPDESVDVWNIATGDLVRRIDANSPTAFSPADQLLAQAQADGTIAVKSIQSNEVLRSLTIDNTDAQLVPFYRIAFSSDGRKVAVTYSTGGVKVWDSKSGRALRSMRLPRSATFYSTFSPDFSALLNMAASPPALYSLVPISDPMEQASRVRSEMKRSLTAMELDVPLRTIIPTLDEGIKLAIQGKTDDAVAKFEDAVKYPGVGFDPQLEAVQLGRVGELRSARKLATDGEIDQAIAIFRKLQSPDSQSLISGSDWNQLCWVGSLWGQGTKVVFAGDLAVGLLPDDFHSRDSRGVARAEAGDFPGAIADLQSFVEGLGDPRAMQVQERVQWIDFLKKNQNPFTPAVLERLRKTEMGSWPQ